MEAVEAVDEGQGREEQSTDDISHSFQTQKAPSFLSSDEDDGKESASSAA